MTAHQRLAAIYADLAKEHEKIAGECGDQYVDQRTSPLGPRLHCRLVRTGELPGYRAGRKLLVRRADLDAYLKRHQIRPTEAGEPDHLDLLLESGGKRTA